MEKRIAHVTFPEEDIVDLPVYQFGKLIKLKSYRFPVPKG